MELMNNLTNGKRVEGVLFVDGDSGKLTFKAYNRQSPKRAREKDRLVKKLPWGWVKESVQRVKVFGSFPKEYDAAEVMGLLEEHTKDAKQAMVEKKLDEKYTCEEIIDTLRGMNMYRPGEKLGYLPAYTRTDLTDALHEAFGFRTDYEILTDLSMRKVIRKTIKK